MLGRRTLTGVIALGAVLSAWSCAGPGTQLSTSWTDPDAVGKHITKLLVIGVAKNDVVRRQYEDSFVRELAQEKVAATASYPVLPDPDAVSEESVTPIIKEGNYSHILVTRLIDRKTVSTYVPPSSTTFVAGYPSYYPSYYGGWGSYYGAAYSTVTSPGYTYDTEYVNLETNVYDITTGKMVWSGVTETELGGKLDGDIANFIDVLVASMKTADVL